MHHRLCWCWPGQAGDRVDREPEIGSRLKSIFLVLLEAAIDDALESRGQTLHELPELLRMLFQDGGDRVRLRVTLERPASSQHLVEDDAKGENVGSLIRLFAARLLWRHVGDGPQHDAGRRVRMV